MTLERNREYCKTLLYEFTLTESLRKHAHAVEACVEYYADMYGEDIDYWANAALLHDFDYERYPLPEDHPFRGAEILRENGFEEEFIQSILSHTNHTGVARATLLRKVLYACDELAGFLLAAVYVRPSKSISDLEPTSVLKKLKDKAFARAVNREDIKNGAIELGISLEEHVANCIHALRERKGLLGI